MIKKYLFFFSILFILPLISSIEIIMDSEFDKQELIIAKVSGNFISPIQSENIFFYRDHLRIGADKDVTKINGEYYIYGILAEENKEGNYSIRLEGVEYVQGAKTIDEDIVLNFTISNQSSAFSLNKGFVITNDSFTIKTQNLLDKKIILSINFEIASGDSTEESESSFGFFSEEGEVIENGDHQFELKSGEIKDISFEVGSITEETLKFIEFSSENTQYNIPVILLPNTKKPSSNQTDEIIDLDKINETENQTTDSETPLPIYAQTCSELNGSICNSSQKCSGETVQAKDAICCIGTCVASEEGGSNVRIIIGWIIILVLGGLAYWFYQKKYRGAKSEFSFSKFFKKKEEPKIEQKSKFDLSKIKK